MNRALVIQHSYAEFLGGFERLLEDRHIGFSYCRPFLGEALPSHAAQYDALWLLGGWIDPRDPICAQLLDQEQRLIAAFRRLRRPVIGIGFGALVVALQAGAQCCTDGRASAAFVTARATGSAGADPLAAAIDGEPVLVFHRAQVVLPPLMASLADDGNGNWLLARADATTYALLFRPEHKPGMLEDLVMESDAEYPVNMAELIDQARNRWDASERLASKVVSALVQALDLMRERKKPPVIALRSIAPDREH
jgi:GMP synthase-like glutamine amidotransferase